ncbi:hypothetical protein GGS23DRAFT_582489 [Durotheca rogersii]|uniref:uncharacterized protein n=1 Tax=Durotheca rogersii TaxID=419775 RepID=UPI002220BBB9|nr:uncharacterized protein GGS23DRAFT_582489 [Durotheca rogersii]KAI5860086.1 hypothetical protein GGS23DRAFT_582489 [Durotheca rogersii]
MVWSGLVLVLLGAESLRVHTYSTRSAPRCRSRQCLRDCLSGLLPTYLGTYLLGVHSRSSGVYPPPFSLLLLLLLPLLLPPPLPLRNASFAQPAPIA